MPKIDRQKIYDKCNGHCAYCGQDITIKEMQVDHVFPQQLKSFLIKAKGVEFGNFTVPDIDSIDDESNLLPSCSRCNNYKSGMPIEEFRRQLTLQTSRARRQSVNFRNAERFGLIKFIDKPIVFYFEELK